MVNRTGSHLTSTLTQLHTAARSKIVEIQQQPEPPSAAMLQRFKQEKTEDLLGQMVTIIGTLQVGLHQCKDAEILSGESGDERREAIEFIIAEVSACNLTDDQAVENALRLIYSAWSTLQHP